MKYISPKREKYKNSCRSSCELIKMEVKRRPSLFVFLTRMSIWSFEAPEASVVLGSLSFQSGTLLVRESRTPLALLKCWFQKQGQLITRERRGGILVENLEELERSYEYIHCKKSFINQYILCLAFCILKSFR